MATLSSLMRKQLPSSAFGEPGSRKYPMPDKAHAAKAKATYDADPRRFAQMCVRHVLVATEVAALV